MKKLKLWSRLVLCLLVISIPSFTSANKNNENGFRIHTLPDIVYMNEETIPNYLIPGGEISYDNGIMENGIMAVKAGGKYAVKMSLPHINTSAVITKALFAFQTPLIGNFTNFEVEVWDASGENQFPGKLIAGPISAEAIYGNGEWTVVDLTSHHIQVNDDFYLVAVQKENMIYAPILGLDRSTFSWRNYKRAVDGQWQQEDQPLTGNYMMRAQIGYHVSKPEITIPDDKAITNHTSILINGTAYTDGNVDSSIILKQNGVNIGTAPVSNKGTFSIPVELIEGNNEFIAISVINGKAVTTSESAHVILDTVAPVLTIASPVDGEKTNRDAITIEGTVADKHLKAVQMNGQDIKIEKDGMFTKRLLLTNGENVINLTAADLAGN